MSLIKCPKCGKMLSEHADKCPACNLSILDFEVFSLNRFNENRNERIKLESLFKKQQTIINNLTAEKKSIYSKLNKKRCFFGCASISLLLICLFAVFHSSNSGEFEYTYDFSEYDKPYGEIEGGIDACDSLIDRYRHIVSLPSELSPTCVYYHKEDRNIEQIWDEGKILIEVKHVGNNKVIITSFFHPYIIGEYKGNYPYTIFDGEIEEIKGWGYSICEGTESIFQLSDRHDLRSKGYYYSYSYKEYYNYDIFFDPNKKEYSSYYSIENARNCFNKTFNR